MRTLKRYLGIAWLLAGPAVWLLLVYSAIHYTRGNATGDIANPVPWVIIIAIFTPIAYGISLFGWYCWKGEYDE